MCNNKHIAELYDEKITLHTNKFLSSPLKPCNNLLRCQHYQQPSLKYHTLSLSLNEDLNILAKLCAASLFKLEVMKTFPAIIYMSLAFLGCLNLHLLEVEAITQVIQHVVSLHSSSTLTWLLSKIMIECYQIELGTDAQFFPLDFEIFRILSTFTQILYLQ